MIKGINGDTFVSTENHKRRFDLGSTFYTLLSGNDRQQPRQVRWVNRIHSNRRYPCCYRVDQTKISLNILSQEVMERKQCWFYCLVKALCSKNMGWIEHKSVFHTCSIWSSEEAGKYGLAKSEISALPQLENRDLLDRLSESCRQHGMFPLLPLHTCHRSQGYGGNIWKYSSFSGWSRAKECWLFYILRLVLHHR